MQPDKNSMERLDAAAKYIFNHRYNQLGYPFDQESGMNDFYGWVERNGLGGITLINVGDPYKTDWDMLNTDES